MDVGPASIADAAAYSLVLPPSVEIPHPPRFTFGAPPASVLSAYFRAAHLHGIGVYSGAGLAWSRGFILDASGALLAGPDIQIHRETIDRLTDVQRVAMSSSALQHINGLAAAIIPPGNAYRIYGHWLVDILPKLAVLDAAGHDVAALRYPVPEDTPAFGLQLMTLFGIPRDHIVTVPDSYRLVADRLLAPASLHNGVRASPLMREAAALFRRAMVRSGQWRAETDGPSRLFLARRGRNRALTNRGRVEDMARQAGFAIVHPEDTSLSEQFALFAGAREILGEYGSAFHTALFSSPGTVVCGLRGDQVHPAFIQSGLGTVLDQPTGYVFGFGEGEHYDFTVSEDAVGDCLASVFDRQHGLAAKRADARPADCPAIAPKPRRQRGFGTVLQSLFQRRAGATSPVAADAGMSIPASPVLSAIAHLRVRGDTPAGADGWMGVPGSGLAIEGVLISLSQASLSAGLSYQTVLADGSRSNLVRSGGYCGTRGKDAPVYGIVVHADAMLQSAYHLSVEAYFPDGSRAGPVPEGVLCRSSSNSALEAVRVIVAPGKRAPGLHTLLQSATTGA